MMNLCRCRVPSVYVPCVPQRYVMCALAVFGIAVGWMVFLGGYKTFQETIAQPYDRQGIPRSYIKGRCFNAPISTNMEAKTLIKVYWSRSIQKGVIQIFWVAYAISSFVGGLAVHNIGPRQVWGVGSVIATITAPMIPSLTKVSPYATMLCLFFYGLGFGIHCPCSSVLVAYWAPENERTIFVAFIESAILLGFMALNVIHDNFKWLVKTWEVWLYVASVVSAVWTLIWYILFYNRPEQHPHISHKQLTHLLLTTPGVKKNHAELRNRVPIVPWKQILLSPSFFSLQLYNLASSWAQCILFFLSHNYILNVFKSDSMIIPSYYVTATGSTIAIFSIIFHAWVSEKLISKRILSRTANRRIILMFTSFASAILFPIIPFLGCRPNLVLIMFLTLIFLQSMSFSLMYANVVDLSPRYAGVLRGILSAGRALSVASCLKLAEVTIKEYGDRYCWVEMFSVSSAILIILSIPFGFFGCGNIQEWNDFPKKKSPRSAPMQSRTESRTNEPSQNA